MKNIGNMKNLLTLIGLFIMATSCGQKTEVKDIPGAAFQEKITQLENAYLIDVRTPEEYSQGHLQNAVNINWNDAAFEKAISELDTNRPALVYCLSGGRSSAAAQKIHEMGFGEVYSLKGGLLKWSTAELTQATTTKSEGMTEDAYAKLTQSSEIVLVDFYAKWCGPCKKMEPYLNELKSNTTDNIEVYRIDIDENSLLTKTFSIEAIPLLKLYKKGQLVWENTGFASKEEVLKQIAAIQ